MADTEFNILSLPDELLTLILVNSEVSFQDVVMFSGTCKHFRDIVLDNPCLWKRKCKTTLPEQIFEIVNRHCDGNWFGELKTYINLKNYIHTEIILMSPKFYRREIEINLTDVNNFFKIALSRNVNYYFTASVLVHVIKEGYSYPNCNMEAKHPYTFTDMFYAKVVLRFLIHACLMLDWVRGCLLNELPPEKVVNFFLQWTDTMNFHLRQDNEKVIQNVVTKVEKLLTSAHPLRNALASDRETWKKASLQNNMWNPQENRQVLLAIKHVLYQESHMNVTPGTNLDTLNIEKALASRFCNATALAALFSGVARRCGVRCDLVAFPNHMFLEWREDYAQATAEVFSINIGTGDLERKRRCPFAAAAAADYQYDPQALLQFLYATFNRTMGSIRDWSTQNGFLLLDFIGEEVEYSPYKNMLSHLMQQFGDNPAALATPLDFKCMNNVHTELIWSLAHLNKERDLFCRQATVKEHDSAVRFSVGMICFHLKFDYLCVVRGWDAACAAAPDWQQRMAVHELEAGADQPFYHVVAADYSERYVAQENLREVTRPTRLYHLEDKLAREFGHFDGFSYIPNEEKEAEFPGDGQIRRFYKTKSEVLIN